MTMKRRIFISNTVMVLFSLLILLGIGGIIVELFKAEFLNVIGQNSKLGANTYEVQSILLKVEDYNGNWVQLSKSLGAYDYQLYVSDQNGEKLYSNVRHSQWECIEELEKIEFDSEQIALYSMENVTIAKKKTIIADNITYIYAAYYPGELSFLGMDRGVFEMFIIVFIVAGILVLCNI